MLWGSGLETTDKDQKGKNANETRGEKKKKDIQETKNHAEGMQARSELKQRLSKGLALKDKKRNFTV